MARSTYVYLICHRSTHAPVAAFTVKYEAETWAEKYSRWPIEQLRMFRTRDGGDRKAMPEFVEIPFDSA